MTESAIGYRLSAMREARALVAADENMLTAPNGPVTAPMMPPSVTVYSPVIMIPVVVGMRKRGPGEMRMRKVRMCAGVNSGGRRSRVWRSAQTGT
jgi:hypothetical protein